MRAQLQEILGRLRDSVGEELAIDLIWGMKTQTAWRGGGGAVRGGSVGGLVGCGRKASTGVEPTPRSLAPRTRVRADGETKANTESTYRDLDAPCVITRDVNIKKHRRVVQLLSGRSAGAGTSRSSSRLRSRRGGGRGCLAHYSTTQPPGAC